ncbi:MAG TPA: archaellin/type IV pilin N-terminal domain-containing protein [Thermoplasmata archaeon]|nr:archaellin/type IV pilin N-terminal domain-containing protein [Thermoplasmata archaeon]
MNKLAWKKRRKDERGEMGVGTLLIFIAMILVAAVAAGVLVSTAYKLQQQAESTGDEALADVSTGFKILAAWGTTDANSVIDNLYLKIALTAGSPGVNLANTTIEVIQTIGGDTASEVTLVFATDASATEFNATELRDMPPSTTAAMMTSGDIFQVHIDLTAADGIDMALDVQERLSLLLMPKHGVPTLVQIDAPPTLEASSVVVL